MQLAFAIQQHRPVLLRTALRLARNTADAHDLVQDTYERALRSGLVLRPGSDARGWLVTILHNLFIDRCRMAARRPHHLPISDQVPAEPAPERPDARGWEDLSWDEVRGALTRLPAPLRRAYELRVAGRSYEQIAKELGVPRATVGTRLHRARAQLRYLLAPLATKQACAA